jgi:hypothetical protein
VLFCGSQGQAVSKYLIPCARRIAEAEDVDQVPQISWGSAVLAGTYRGLCSCVSKGAAEEGILLGCPLLVQLWSYEHLQVGRPTVDLSPFAAPPEGHDDVDLPIKGSLWCLCKVRTVSFDFVALFIVRIIYRNNFLLPFLCSP